MGVIEGTIEVKIVSGPRLIEGIIEVKTVLGLRVIEGIIEVIVIEQRVIIVIDKRSAHSALKMGTRRSHVGLNPKMAR